MRSSSVQREIIGGDSTTSIGDDLHAVKTRGAAPLLQKAVVIEVIVDPMSLTEDEKDNIADQVNNPELVSVIPANSVIAMITSNAGGQGAATNTILFPFFSSHVQMPVKVGETVYVLYEDYSDTGTKMGFWFTRISSQGTVEDVNYTHYDRMFDSTMNPDNYDLADRSIAKPDYPGPGFQNGGGTTETVTLQTDTSVSKKQDPFDQIKASSKSNVLTTNEPVPRFKKRPGDYVIQGSNNTLISLGEDRIGPLESPDDIKGQSGTIDIVVGRGRKLGNPTDEDFSKTTSARVVRNTKGEIETDKAPYRQGWTRKDNPKEGDPDLVNDAARFYVSMQTNADKNFGLQLSSNNSLSLPELPAASKTSSFNKSFVVGKADHIRLIARKDDNENVKGTVLLIREGEEDADLGYFFIDDSGQVQIEGRNIYIGKATDEKNPVVLYQNYEKTILALQAQIDILTKGFADLLAGNFGNLGAPIPGILTASPAVAAAIPEQKAVVEGNTKPEQHSDKIFVENSIKFGG